MNNVYLGWEIHIFCQQDFRQLQITQDICQTSVAQTPDELLRDTKHKKIHLADCTSTFSHFCPRTVRLRGLLTKRFIAENFIILCLLFKLHYGKNGALWQQISYLYMAAFGFGFECFFSSVWSKTLCHPQLNVEYEHRGFSDFHRGFLAF